MLDEMTRRNASKFAKFYKYVNIVYVTMAFIRGKNKVARNERWENLTLGFRTYKIWQILKRFTGSFLQA